MRLLTSLILTCAAVYADDAADVFRKAVKRQGSLRRDEIKSVNLEFHGHALLKKTEQALYREYWYTSKDRTFRQVTQGKAGGRERSERGIDKDGSWVRSGETKVRLSRGNRDHAKLIKAIDADRTDFERILQMVLLTRLEGARISFAKNAPVKLRADLPWSARSILGEDREKSEYHVLRVESRGQPPLLLFVRTSDYTVRKAVQFDPKNHAIYYYFAYSPDGKLPAYFSAHKSKPIDKKTRKSSTLARGEIFVRLER